MRGSSSGISSHVGLHITSFVTTPRWRNHPSCCLVGHASHLKKEEKKERKKAKGKEKRTRQGLPSPFPPPPPPSPPSFWCFLIYFFFRCFFRLHFWVLDPQSFRWLECRVTSGLGETNQCGNQNKPNCGLPNRLLIPPQRWCFRSSFSVHSCTCEQK